MSHRPPATLLIVEDDPVQCGLYESVLGGPAWRLVVAATLAEADRALATEAVDAVLLDLFLPDGDGRSWLGRVRDRAEWANLPVVVVAGTAAVEAQVDLYALGASTVLEKPVAPAVLAAALQGVLARAAARRRDDLVDEATGLPSRAALVQAYARARAEGAAEAPLAVALIEPDAPLGPDAAGPALRRLAAAVGDAADPSPVTVGRWLEGTVAALLPGFDAAGAGAVLERARQAVRAGDDGSARFSAGVAEAAPGQSFAEAAADAGLHLTAARLAGGDRVRWRDGEGVGERTILIAEDDQVVSALLTHRLKREGFMVELAANGVQALELARGRPLALVVLDIMMPGMDGFEVLTHLRALPQYARLPIVILSGLGSERDVERALELGADDYVIKPFSPVELTARVQRLLRTA